MMRTICLFIFRHIIARFVSTRDFVKLMIQNNLTPEIYTDLVNKFLSEERNLKCDLNEEFCCCAYRRHEKFCVNLKYCKHQIQGD